MPCHASAKRAGLLTNRCGCVCLIEAYLVCDRPLLPVVALSSCSAVLCRLLGSACIFCRVPIILPPLQMSHFRFQFVPQKVSHFLFRKKFSLILIYIYIIFSLHLTHKSTSSKITCHSPTMASIMGGRKYQIVYQLGIP